MTRALIALILLAPLAAAQGLRVVCFGDSTTAPRATVEQVYSDRVPAVLRARGVAARTINAGVCGSHTGRLADDGRHVRRHALDRLDDAVRAHAPDVVVVQFGVNDSWVDSDEHDGESRIPLEAYRRNLTEIANALRADGAAVIVMTPNALGPPHAPWRVARTAEYARVAREVAADTESRLVDVWAAYESHEEEGGARGDLLLDGTHPNDAGHALVAELLVEPIAAAAAARQRLALPWVFADHMVLQRERALLILGAAAPGAEIAVSFAGVKRRARAGDDGRWRVELPPLRASEEGRVLRVASGNEELVFEDVLVGEVWLCAGQSNMDLPLSRAAGGSAAAEAADLPRLRLCDRSGISGSRRRYGAADYSRCAPESYYRGSWRVSSRESAPSFSAVGYFAGLELLAALDVPIGLIDLSVGGSSTEGWIPRERLATDAALAPLADDYLGTPLSHPFVRERSSDHLEEWIDAGRPAPRPRHPFEPGFLFEAAIAPLAPFPVAGVLWYQGESNAHLPSVADGLFRELIDAWRAAWAAPALPVLVVQLPGMGRPDWPAFRNVQAGWESLDAVSVAVAIDVGHPTNVHPIDKRPVGERLARLALSDLYGREVPARGPLVLRAARRGETLVLSFAHADGLEWAPGRGPTGFEVAGEDRRFHPATAELRGDEVHLRSEGVPRPLWARYAWAPFPEWSLVNGAELPAAPFRSHEWEPVRVACVGDSITRGYGLADPATKSYPARLRELLGDGFEVRGFGRDGAGVVLSFVRGQELRAFRHHYEHEEALLFAPDVVVSILGINDIGEWDGSEEDFVADYRALIDEFRALPTRPQVLIASPLSPLFPGQRFHGDPREAEIERALARVAREAGVASVDLGPRVRDHPEWFPDHLHPNADGAAAIAEAVRDALRRIPLPFAPPA